MLNRTPKFDIAFALKKVTIPGFRKTLKEEDRFAIAGTILEQLKLCRWEFRTRAGIRTDAPDGSNPTATRLFSSASLSNLR